MSAPENPQAFPGAAVLQRGMTLRDWFAGQALAGFTSLPEEDMMGALDTARAAYNYADAMLAERAKGGAA